MLLKVRATLVIAALWVLCWVPFGLALEDVLVPLFMGPEPWIDSPYMGLKIWILWGALSGLSFAIVLAFGERGRAVGRLSVLRVLSWGAIGSALVAILYSAYLLLTAPTFVRGSLFWISTGILVAVSAFLGTICALITMALLREGAVQNVR